MSGRFWEQVVEPLVSYLTPPCKEVARLLSSALEEPLPVWRRAQLQLHYLICDGCHRYGEQLKILRRVLRRFHTHTQGEPLPPEARARIAEKLRAAAAETEK